jgi:hypothetical protein
MLQLVDVDVRLPKNMADPQSGARTARRCLGTARSQAAHGDVRGGRFSNEGLVGTQGISVIELQFTHVYPQ